MYFHHNFNYSCTYPHSDVSLTAETNSCDPCDKSFSSSTTLETHSSLDSSPSSNSCIIQLDGNISLSSEDSFAASSDHSICSSSDHPSEISCPNVNSITVQIGNRPPPLYAYDSNKNTRFLKTLRRSNKAVQGLSLPAISNYNMRSLLPKLDSFAEDFEERDTGLSFLTEIWEKSCNKKHQNKLNELFEMKGLLYISTPRPGLKRGGGVAIAADPTRFSLTKFNVPNPHQLEVSWGLLKPKQVTGPISKIICCAFYSPPNSRKKTKLIDHLYDTLQVLLLDHPGAGVVIAGDRNDLSIERLLSVDSTLRQIVKYPTHGRKVLDVVLTNIWRFYNDPVIVSPVAVDDPSKGVPSDHLGVFVEPVQNADILPARSKKIISFRPKPESRIRDFVMDICQMSWSFMSPTSSSTELTDAFQNKISEMVDNHFPLKTMTITDSDQPWITKDLKN